MAVAIAHPGSDREIRVLICDDHRLLTDCLAAVVRASRNLSLVAEPVAAGDRAVAIAAELRPDVALIDVHLEGPIDGIETVRRLSVASPSTRAIVITDDRNDRWLYDAIEAGAMGLHHKADAVERLLESVEAAARGEVLFDPVRVTEIANEAARERSQRQETRRRLDRVTERERQVLGCLRGGLGNHEIATALFISPRTVETHIQHLLAKLDVHSKLEAVAFIHRAEALGAVD